MWTSIMENERTWVRFKTHFQEAHLDWEELKQTAGAAEYRSENNVKHGEMKELFMDFSSVTAERDSAFTELTTSNVNLTKQLRHQEDQIWSLQADMCNLKLLAAQRSNHIANYVEFSTKCENSKNLFCWCGDARRTRFNRSIQNIVPNAPFMTLNGTHHAALRSIV